MAAVAISIGAAGFSPARVSVKVGDVVTWTNNDTVAHTVNFDNPAHTDSGDIAPGGTFVKTFDAATPPMKYRCGNHASMHGSIEAK